MIYIVVVMVGQSTFQEAIAMHRHFQPTKTW